MTEPVEDLGPAPEPVIGRMAPDVPLPPLQWCPRCKYLRPTTEEDRGARVLCEVCKAEGTDVVHVAGLDRELPNRRRERSLALWIALAFALTAWAWAANSFEAPERPASVAGGAG